MRRIHQVVAWAFIGSQPIGLYACHDDGDITNNWAYNIYYGTAVQNQLDRRRHGRLGIGESHHAAYLTVKDVLEIRERLAANEKQSEIAVAFGVTASCISEIKTRARWDHV
jgi:urease accessory protein UreF